MIFLLLLITVLPAQQVGIGLGVSNSQGVSDSGPWPSLTLDGVNDRVDVTDNAGLRHTDSWTASILFKPKTLPVSGTWFCPIGKGNNTEIAGGNHSFAIVVENNIFGSGPAVTALYESSTGANTFARYATTLTTGDWYHLQAVHDASADTLTLYVDGTQQAQNTSATDIPDVSTADIFFGPNVGDSPSAFGHMEFVDAQLYHKALTTGELTSIRNGTRQSDCKLHIKGTDGSGATAADDVGSNDGSITGTESEIWANTQTVYNP